MLAIETPDAAPKLRIGIDFDNTIAAYDEVFRGKAIELGLVDGDFRGDKLQLRNMLRQRPDGELEWQRLQSHVYGPGMASATLFDGVDSFLRRCRDAGYAVFIVSHKTEYAHHDPMRVNLRHAALNWMMSQGFFSAQGYGLSLDHVFFESTRAEKLARITTLNCAFFIDDLEEVLLDPGFPSGVKRILYARTHHSTANDCILCSDWQNIADVIFQGPH